MAFPVLKPGVTIKFFTPIPHNKNKVSIIKTNISLKELQFFFNYKSPVNIYELWKQNIIDKHFTMS